MKWWKSDGIVWNLTPITRGASDGATHALLGYREDKIARPLSEHYEPFAAYLVLPGDDVEAATQRLLLEARA